MPSLWAVSPNLRVNRPNPWANRPKLWVKPPKPWGKRPKVRASCPKHWVDLPKNELIRAKAPQKPDKHQNVKVNCERPPTALPICRCGHFNDQRKTVTDRAGNK